MAIRTRRDWVVPLAMTAAMLVPAADLWAHYYVIAVVGIACSGAIAIRGRRCRGKARLADRLTADLALG
ncbi:MAG: hypothetical protein QUU85_18355 [Candidatus Eisenbacteria bacterium]|nr:hypothetical protein [Candidatus Eisenbacteria bacterium]